MKRKLLILILCFICAAVSSFGAGDKMRKAEECVNYGKVYDKESVVLVKGEKLYIKLEELDIDGNNPTKITLKIKKSKIVIESEWNDGIYIGVTDFDKTDNKKDIFVTETGTDIVSSTTIYSFDGEKLYKYAEFSHCLTNFLYDEMGLIYFDNPDGGEEDIKKYKSKYNYKKRKIELQKK